MKQIHQFNDGTTAGSVCWSWKWNDVEEGRMVKEERRKQLEKEDYTDWNQTGTN